MTGPSPDAAPTPAGTQQPYAGLDPQCVLEALDAVGLRGDGRLIQLNSYENRVYQVFLEDGRVVVAKFYRPHRWSNAQILEEHGYTQELAERELPVAAPWALVPADPLDGPGRVTLLAPTLALWTTPAATHRFSVSTRLAGRAPELEDAATLEWIGRLVARMHAVGARAPFEQRLRLDPATFGTAARDELLAQRRLPLELERDWRDVTDRALDAVVQAFERCASTATLRLHGDCHMGNVLWNAQGPHFVDFDDAVSGPAIQDLWMLLSGDRHAMNRQLRSVLGGYERFMDFDDAQLRLIEPLRTLRILHHSAWIARRWADPAFPIAFPWFDSPSYWAEQTIRLREQVQAMAEPPLGAPG
jgi:Ser/Thr protein kinase RdoA (MazF antagonist)